MANFINVANASGNKGCFPIGTGLSDGPNFCSALPPPINPATGAILPGYALNTNATSLTGLEWAFTGAGGSTIKQYKFPATSTPNPFPTPAVAASDLVLIQREDLVTTGRGLQDLSMPILGAQGFVPQHSLPSLCDSASGVVFFFDRANAAINVYNVATKTWRIGWLKGVLTETFAWRAASLLTPDLISVTYAAPYDSTGIFLSAVSTSWKTNNPTITKTGIASNFLFVSYTVTNGEINPIDNQGDINDVTDGAAGDWGVSAICAVDTNLNPFSTPAYATTVNQLVCAFAVDETSTLTNDGAYSFGWWGFMGRIVAGGDKTALNPNCSIVTDYASLASFVMKSDLDTPTGYIQTISVGTDTDQYKFFLGGNYSRLRFGGTLIERPISGAPQISAVAMIFNMGQANVATATSYQFIGTNSATQALVRDWRGRVIQSNYAAGYFYLCGSFVAPPSLFGVTDEVGPNPITTPSFPVDVNAGYEVNIPQAGIIQGVSRTLTPAVEVLGGQITTMTFQVPSNSQLPLPLATGGGTATSAGVCFSVTPLEGNLTQASYPLLQIGGSGNVPTEYSQPTTSAIFQTKLPVVPNAWYYSSIEIYVDTAYFDVYVDVYLWQTADSASATAQFQYELGPINLVAGLNSLGIFGGGASAFDAALMNSNVISGVVGVPPLSATPQLMRAQLFFFSDGLKTPLPVSVGQNPRNGQQPFPFCWNLNGFDATSAGRARGYFSATTTNVALANIAGGKRTLTYSNLAIDVPLTADSLVVQFIPINQDISTRTLLLQTENDFKSLIVQAFILHDTQGNTRFSGMTFAADSKTLATVPKLTGGVNSQPTFSLFGNSQFEVYKVGWANQSNVAFGIYTSFPQFTNLSYTALADTTVPTGAGNFGKFAFQTAQNVIIFSTNNILINAADGGTFNVAFDKLKTGDMLILKSAGGQNTYNVTAQPTLTADYFTIAVQILSGSTNFAVDDAVSISATLNADPEAQPIVLSENLGAYWLGNGSAPSTERDIYLSSFNNTGKAYRYVPAYDTTYLLFDSEVYIGGNAVDNTFTADTLVFNTNYSSVLLAKSATDTTKWVVASTNGSIGYSNLSK